MLTEPLPRVSVVVPSHARAALLARTLAALARQTLPPEAYEVIAVLDGAAAPDVAPPPEMRCRLLVLRQPRRGSCAARNRGAERARAPLLVFLDDDMEAEPALLAEHLAAQRARPGLVLGGFATTLPPGASLVARAHADWWAREQAARLQPGYVLSHRDCWSGNMSLPRALWAEVGGFDEAFGVHASGTDVEFGARLLERGVPVTYAPAAHAEHHEHATHRAMRRRAENAGAGHLLIARRHPALLATLPVGEEPRAGLQRLVAPFRWRRPAAAERAAAPLWLALGVVDRLGWARGWRALSARLQQHAYWCGVARESGGRAGWLALGGPRDGDRAPGPAGPLRAGGVLRPPVA